MAYVQRPIVDVEVTKLRLDLQNYRIPSRPEDEAQALAYLFASEEVLESATEILLDGYFDNEVPIVVEEDSGYVVLEGNRRVSALKALHDPGLVPSHTTQLHALLKRYATEALDLPRVVRVIVASDRTAARPRVARLHTGLSKRRWSRDQQATFYYALLESGASVGDLKSEYRGVDIPRFIRMAVVRRFLTAVEFEDHTLRDYVSGSGLRMSAFEYAYRSKDIASAVGIVFAADGTLVPQTSPPERIAKEISLRQREALEYLVGEFRDGRLNTRSPQFKKDLPKHRVLVERLGGNAGEGSSVGDEGPSGGTNGTDATSDRENHGNEGKAPGDKAPNNPRGPNHPDTKDRLELAGIDYGSAPVNLQRRYYELRGIKFTAFPVTTAILLRSILEMTIKWHFETTETPATGMLAKAFTAVTTTYGGHRPLKNTIAAIRSGDAHRPGSVAWFNYAAHDVNAVVKADDVLQAWEQVNPLLRHLLREPLARS